MKIFYQGTAAAEGVPAVFCDCKHCRMARTAGGKEVRMRSGALIDGVLKIDFGPDAYAQSLRFGHSYVPVEHVLITHSHRDHLCESDLACIHPPYSHREKPLTVYGDARVGERLKPFCDDNELVFVQLKPFETVTVGDYAVTPLPTACTASSGVTA